MLDKEEVQKDLFELCYEYNLSESFANKFVHDIEKIIYSESNQIEEESSPSIQTGDDVLSATEFPEKPNDQLGMSDAVLQELNKLIEYYNKRHTNGFISFIYGRFVASLLKLRELATASQESKSES